MTKEQFEALCAMVAAMIAKALDKGDSADTGLNSSIEQHEAIETARVAFVDAPAEAKPTEAVLERVVQAQLPKDACETCAGTGRIGWARCAKCKGSGKKSK